MSDIVSSCRSIVGGAHVLTGPDADRWRRDWTGAYRADPVAVVRPASTGQVSALMRMASDTDTPVVPVSGNTGLTGGTSGQGMLMISLDRMNRIHAVDPLARTATVEAGVILSDLHHAADEVGLSFPLTFGARGSAMIGGALSTNAGGSNVLRYGNARDLCLGVEAVLADGRVLDVMASLHKNNSGFDLRHLMIGAEGQLGLITGAVLKLQAKPRAYATSTLAMRSLTDALALLRRLQDETGNAVEAFEYMPRGYIDRHLALISGAREPFGERYDTHVFVELASHATGGDVSDLNTRLETILGDELEAGAVLDATIAQNEAQRAEMWQRREDAGEITFQGGPFVTADIAMPLEQVSGTLADISRALGRLDPDAKELVVAHLGDGNIHHTAYLSREDPDLADAVVELVEDVVQERRGAFSAEHGVGKSKLASMSRRKDGVALDVMRAIKQALDPKGILNPGKVLPPTN